MYRDEAFNKIKHKKLKNELHKAIDNLKIDNNN